MKLTNHTVLVPGGTSGLGLAMAQQFAKLGNQVIILGRNQARLDKILAENLALKGYSADVSDVAALEKLAENFQKDFPKLDLLVNSAGMMRAINLFDEAVKISDLSAEMTTNFTGTVQATKAFLPLLTANHGAVINISSGLANLADGAHPIYNASKTAVRFFTDALREQAKYFAKDLTVVELVPPLVAETNLEPEIGAEVAGNMSLADFIAETFAGLAAGLDRIDVGFAKEMWTQGKVNSEENTRQLSVQMLNRCFPKTEDEK